jgi:hypothetical protein
MRAIGAPTRNPAIVTKDVIVADRNSGFARSYRCARPGMTALMELAR